MRRHRVALITAAALVASVAIALPVASSGTDPTGTAHQEATVWSSTPIPPSVTDQQAMTHERAQFTAYTTTVISNEKAALQALAVIQAAQAAAAAKAAAARAEATRATSGSTSPTSTTTPPPVTSGGSGVDQLLTDAPAYVVNAFHCIAYGHESGGNPTAINPTSGDSGLYQFNVNTWLGNGGGQFAPQAYEAPVWAQDTVAYWTWQHDGFQPWTGDNSCWE